MSEKSSIENSPLYLGAVKIQYAEKNTVVRSSIIAIMMISGFFLIIYQPLIELLSFLCYLDKIDAAYFNNDRYSSESPDKIVFEQFSFTSLNL